MALKMFGSNNILMQPKNKREKVNKMNNYCWLNRFNDTSSWEPFLYWKWGGIYSFIQLVNGVRWLDFVCDRKSNLVKVRVNIQ